MSEEQPKKRGRKPKKKPYFGPEQEEAVVKYLSLGSIIEDPSAIDGVRWTGTTQEEVERNRIYVKSLRAPLDKMIESIIRTYKLYSKTMEFEDLHTDALSFLNSIIFPSEVLRTRYNARLPLREKLPVPLESTSNPDVSTSDEALPTIRVPELLIRIRSGKLESSLASLMSYTE